MSWKEGATVDSQVNQGELDLKVSPAGATFTDNRMPMQLMFTNLSSKDVRLLDCFEPLPVFFTFKLVGRDGTPIDMPGGGKIDFGPQPPGYIDLKPGATYSLDVDIARLISKPLSTGLYRISAIYHNQYGQDCFQGKLQSDWIEVEIERST